MKRLYSIIVAILLVMALPACSLTQVAPSPGPKPVIGDITPQAVYLGLSDVEKISDSKVKDWYQSSHKKPGLHSQASGVDQYLLISAGEQRTAGYFIDGIRVTGEEKGLRVTAKLFGPDKESVVAQVITYPHVMVRIPADKRDLVFSLDQLQQVVTYQTDSARFVQKIGADIVEVKISGKPDSMPATSFKLGLDLKARIDGLSLAKDDVVRFVSVAAQDNQKMIIDMVKIGPTVEPNLSWKGKYVGQIDGNSVEIIVDGKTVACRLSEELKSQIDSLGLKKDDTVHCEYVTNEHGQYVLTKLEKTK